MRTILLIAALASALTLSGCDDKKTIDGVTYGSYGLVSEKDMRNPNIEYEVSGWSVFWAVVLCETVVVPIYIVGWDLYKPVGKLDPNKVKGSVSR